VRVWHMETWDGIVTHGGTRELFELQRLLCSSGACRGQKGPALPLGVRHPFAFAHILIFKEHTLARSGTPLSRVFSGIA
jgi:hypothetical protein